MNTKNGLQNDVDEDHAGDTATTDVVIAVNDNGDDDDEGKARVNCRDDDNNNTADDGPSKCNNQLDDDNEQGCHASTGVAGVAAVAFLCKPKKCSR